MKNFSWNHIFIRTNGTLRTECKKCFNNLSYKNQKIKREKSKINKKIYDFENELKLCPECKDWKTFNQFYKNKSESKGLSTYCLHCNRLLMKGAMALRRARMKGIKISKIEYKKILEKFNNECVYCFTKLTKENIEWDHYIPVSKNGENIINNIVCSCNKCNKSKHNKLPLEFLKYKYGDSDLALEIIEFITKKILGL